MNLNDLTPEEFSKVCERVREARIALFDAIEDEITARAELARERARFILEGLEGKNQAERDAELQTLLYTWQIDLERAEKRVRVARVNHELAVLDLDCLRYQLRAAEAVLQLESSEREMA